MIIYGLLINKISIIITNSMVFICSIIMLFLKYLYREKNDNENDNDINIV